MKPNSRANVPRLVGARPAPAASDFPYEGIASEKLAFLVNYATLAPSGHNTQPWKFEIRGPVLELRADFSRSMPVTDPDGRELVMSCGAALLYLRVAVRNFGHTGRAEPCPDPDQPDLLARLTLTGRAPAGRTDHNLFKAIGERRTARVAFGPREIPRALLYRWQRAAMYEDAWLHLVESPETRRHIAELIAEGDSILGQNSDYRTEIARWMRSNDDAGRDGLPGYSIGLGALSSRVAPCGMFPHGHVQAMHDLDLVLKAPAFVVLGTGEDDRTAWMTAGQALARVLLAAQVEGASASFFLQPVELPHLRERLMSLMPEETGYPQITFRLGYGPRVPPTPRRPLSQVLAVLEPGDTAEGGDTFDQMNETKDDNSE
jgi:nitroreductase